MDDLLHNLDEALRELEGISIRTTQGAYVKLDDVRRLIARRKDAAAAQQAADQQQPPPKTVEQARAQVKRDPEIMKNFPARVTEPGRAVPAQQVPQPKSSS